MQFGRSVIGIISRLFGRTVIVKIPEGIIIVISPFEVMKSGRKLPFFP
jgi:hypothetical protein